MTSLPNHYHPTPSSLRHVTKADVYIQWPTKKPTKCSSKAAVSSSTSSAAAPSRAGSHAASVAVSAAEATPRYLLPDQRASASVVVRRPDLAGSAAAGLEEVSETVAASETVAGSAVAGAGMEEEEEAEATAAEVGMVAEAGSDTRTVVRRTVRLRGRKVDTVIVEAEGVMVGTTTADRGTLTSSRCHREEAAIAIAMAAAAAVVGMVEAEEGTRGRTMAAVGMMTAGLAVASSRGAKVTGKAIPRILPT